MKNKSKNGVIGGLFWTFGERVSTQLIATIVTLVLARILSPEHYGLISIVSIFIALCNIFVTSGFGSSIVREKNASEEDFNTAFFLSLSISLVVYIILFFLAPFAASFYNMPALTAVMRVMGLTVPLSSLSTIQHAHLQREMEFKRYFIASLFGTVLSGVVGIIMALRGFGVWALVAQHLTNVAVDIIVLHYMGDWKPKLQFSKKSAFGIFSFGWKVLASNFVSTLESNLRSLIVGKVFGSADLAFYDQGRKYTSLLVDNVNSAINTVMLPVYAKYQDDYAKLKSVLRRSIKMGIFCLSPILIGFMAVSENFVIVFLTEKWLPCVPYLQICCIAYLTRPLETTCHKMILAIGKSDTVLIIMTLINIVAFATLLIAAFIYESMLYVALGSLLVSLTSLLCFMAASFKLIGYTPFEQLEDILPGLLISFCMFVCTYFVGKIQLLPIISLIIQIITGVLSYVVLSLIFNRCIVKDLMNIILKKLKKEQV